MLAGLSDKIAPSWKLLDSRLSGMGESEKGVVVGDWSTVLAAISDRDRSLIPDLPFPASRGRDELRSTASLATRIQPPSSRSDLLTIALSQHYGRILNLLCVC